MTRTCALCEVLGEGPRPTQSTVGVNTAIPGLIARAVDRVDDGSEPLAHVVAPMCPEHVIDVYRGRVEGVAMAWRATPLPA